MAEERRRDEQSSGTKVSTVAPPPIPDDEDEPDGPEGALSDGARRMLGMALTLHDAGGRAGDVTATETLLGALVNASTGSSRGSSQALFSSLPDPPIDRLDEALAAAGTTGDAASPAPLDARAQPMVEAATTIAERTGSAQVRSRHVLAAAILGGTDVPGARRPAVHHGRPACRRCSTTSAGGGRTNRRRSGRSCSPSRRRPAARRCSTTNRRSSIGWVAEPLAEELGRSWCASCPVSLAAGRRSHSTSTARGAPVRPRSPTSSPRSCAARRARPRTVRRSGSSSSSTRGDRRSSPRRGGRCSPTFGAACVPPRTSGAGGSSTSSGSGARRVVCGGSGCRW